jgi:hypothetical protein
MLDKRAYDNFPEHQVSVNSISGITYDKSPQQKGSGDSISGIRRVESRLGIRTPALMLLTYVVPILILLVWICLLIIL